jgi:signal transduction histidine kinase
MPATQWMSTRDRLDAVYDLALELSAERRLDAVLDVALRQCLRLTDSEFGFIGLVPEGAAIMDIVAIHGFHPAPAFFTQHRTIPLRPNVFARVVLEDRPVRTDDASAEPNRVGQPDGHPPVAAFLGVPLRVDGRPIGMIGVANRPGPYEEDHERLLLTYAGLVAMQVRNAQLYEALQTANDSLERLVAARTLELAAARDALAEKADRLQAVLADMADAGEQERRRIASDLHDSVNQLLIGAMLEIRSGRHRLDTGDHGSASKAFESAQSILAQVEAEIRSVVNDLHPPVLEGLGLVPAVRELAERFEAISGVTCRMFVRGPHTRLPSRSEIGLYRVCQEALRNVAVHAGAKHVDISLVFEPRHVTFAIHDDGRGFDPLAPQCSAHGGFGLESMRRRIEDLAGRWALVSRPGLGTRILAWVPLP